MTDTNGVTKTEEVDEQQSFDVRPLIANVNGGLSATSYGFFHIGLCLRMEQLSKVRQSVIINMDNTNFCHTPLISFHCEEFLHGHGTCHLSSHLFQT